MNRLSSSCLLTVPPKSFLPVLLHNENSCPSIPLTYSIQIKEGYENVTKILLKATYAEFNWYVCDYFNMLEILLGLHGGYTKYLCFICLWNSTADGKHCENIHCHWPPREELRPGRYNVIKELVVSRENVFYCHFFTFI